MNTEKKRMLAHSFLCAGVVFVIIAMPRVGLASEQEVGEAVERVEIFTPAAVESIGSDEPPYLELYYEDYDPNYDESSDDEDEFGFDDESDEFEDDDLY